MFGFGKDMIFCIPGLILALSVHEYAHALAAVKCGDESPRMMGRLTLNPIQHIDPWGLIALFFFKFGWGRPVPINPNNFNNPKRDEIVVSLAGPVANLLLAIVTGLVLGIVYKAGMWTPVVNDILY